MFLFLFVLVDLHLTPETGQNEVNNKVILIPGAQAQCKGILNTALETNQGQSHMLFLYYFAVDPTLGLSLLSALLSTDCGFSACHHNIGFYYQVSNFADVASTLHSWLMMSC